MRKTLVAALALSLLAPNAFAQDTLTGADVILALAAARGVTLTPAEIADIRAGKVLPGGQLFNKLRTQLRVSANVFATLATNATNAVRPNVVTQAVLESATGKTLTTAQVQSIVASNPAIAVDNIAELNALITNPQQANTVVAQAQQSATPTRP